MRCDVNVSVRPKGEQRLRTRVEIKNMNSLSSMQKAIEFEVNRQVLPGAGLFCLLMFPVTRPGVPRHLVSLIAWPSPAARAHAVCIA